MNEELRVETGKSFAVSAEQLYNAWTSPDELKQWWKPMGNQLAEVINDIKEGGEVRYIFENSKLIISGKYLEVHGKEKLVYTWNWEMPQDAIYNAEYKLTVEFLNKDGGSELRVLQENFKDEETLQPHRDGWEKELSNLADYLSSNGGNATTAQQQQMGGYREVPEQEKVGGG